MATIAVTILFLAWLLWHYLTYNSLVTARNAIDQSWSNTEVELKRRLDLIVNLVEVVKGYAQHEGDTLMSVVKARGPSTTNAALATQAVPFLKDTFGKIFAIAEQYPDLKANDQFLNLQRELTNTENRIAERRHAYNQNVAFYENLRLAFPNSVVANIHDFAPRALFDAPDNLIREAVPVKFS